MLKQISPADKESFRVIAKKYWEALVMEFALRTGEVPRIVNPFVVDTDFEAFDQEGRPKDNPNYFRDTFPLAQKHSEELEDYSFIIDSIIMGWGREDYRLTPLGLFGQTLRQIFTYNASKSTKIP